MWLTSVTSCFCTAESTPLQLASCTVAMSRGGSTFRYSRSGCCRHLDSLALIDTGALFSQDLHAGELTVKRLAVESPLEIVMSGVGVALVLAVILSGGTIKFDAKSGAFEATMPALGEGIGKLREALAQTHAPLGYGVRQRPVKLSKREFKELMKFDPASEKKGGFQRFFIGMQCRIDRKTRELELSPHDVDVVLKYGRQPKKGGWQASIRKIFGQHFDLTAEAQRRARDRAAEHPREP